MLERPQVVLLDVNGTLTDPGPIGAPWGAPELGHRVLAEAVRSSMVEALVGGERHEFSSHIRAAIEVVVDQAGLDPAGIDEAVSAAASLPARPGAREALHRLASAGVRLVALTNSGAEAGKRTLHGCGLGDSVERVLGTDAVATFKPHPRVYEYALRETGVEAGAAMLLATHPWDLAGADHAGIGTAWVRHGAATWPSVFPRAGVVAGDLPEAARSILAA